MSEILVTTVDRSQSIAISILLNFWTSLVSNVPRHGHAFLARHVTPSSWRNVTASCIPDVIYFILSFSFNV